jgi:hypothetical protein
MNWFVYKCDIQNRKYQNAYGDWRDFFDERKEHFDERKEQWGHTDWVRRHQLDQLEQGDLIIAYQTNRNEIVGLAEVWQSTKTDGYLYLRPRIRIGVKVRPLKADPAIDAIKAFQPGVVQTIYSITGEEARQLLRAAGVTSIPVLPVDGESSEESFNEGGTRSVVQSVRSDKLRGEAKRKYGLECYCCGFKFEDFYGEIACGRAIVHHLETFSGSDGSQRVSTVKDVRVVCANCHYVIHLSKEPLDVDELKAVIEKRWSPWTDEGVTRKKQTRSPKRPG